MCLYLKRPPHIWDYYSLNPYSLSVAFCNNWFRSNNFWSYQKWIALKADAYQVILYRVYPHKKIHSYNILLRILDCNFTSILITIYHQRVNISDTVNFASSHLDTYIQRYSHLKKRGEKHSGPICTYSYRHTAF